MGSGGLQQTNALFRKNLVIQRRACKTNCCLILFPLILCSAIGGLQIAINLSQQKDTTVVNCSCNNAIVPENTPGGAVCPDDCPLPHPPKWPPVVQIPPSFRDRYGGGIPGASCGGGGAQGSCAATFLVTGTNQSFVGNVMGNMIPVHDTSVNVPAGDISALADFVLAGYSGFSDSPEVDSFLQNKCTPNLTLSYAFAYSNVTKTRVVDCTEGLMLWRDSSWLISDDLYAGYTNRTSEIAAAYDFLSSDQGNFNLIISYNSTYEFHHNDFATPIIQFSGGNVPRMLQVPRLTNMTPRLPPPTLLSTTTSSMTLPLLPRFQLLQSDAGVQEQQFSGDPRRPPQREDPRRPGVVWRFPGRRPRLFDRDVVLLC